MRYPAVLICLLLLACESEQTLPIADELMIDVLYDKHIAQAALNRVSDAARDSMYAVYHGQILERHSVSEEDWQRAMEYLLDDLEAYEKLQTVVKDRLRADVDK